MKYSSDFFFSQKLRNERTILSLGALQTQAVARIWLGSQFADLVKQKLAATAFVISGVTELSVH